MIAISYRREDSSPVTGRLFDRLQAEFGRRNVFMDFDSIPFGVDFRDKIKVTLEKAQVVVAVVGPNWTGNREGKRRIDDPRDFVRIEIAAALERGIPVIPVLLDNTVMPEPEQLPEELRPFAFRNALTLNTGVDFHHHASRLISGIHEIVHGRAPRETGSGGRWPVVVGAMLLAGLIAGGIWWLVNAPRPAQSVATIAPTSAASVSPVPTAPSVVQAASSPVTTAAPPLSATPTATVSLLSVTRRSVSAPPNFHRINSRTGDTYRTVVNERFQSADGAVEFGVLTLQMGDLPATAESRRIPVPHEEGETVTERTPSRSHSLFHEDVTMVGPRNSYTRYFAMDASLSTDPKATSTLWEFWVRDERALQTYKETYRAFKDSVKY